MGLISGAINTYYTFKFLRLLTQKWNTTDAFKLGIVDTEGKALKKVADLNTTEEKAAYSVFNRLVFNVKRIMNKVPFGRSALVSYAAALYLLKEHEVDFEHDQIVEKLQFEGSSINEDLEWFVLKDGCLMEGTYQLNRDIVSPITGIVTGHTGNKIIIESNCNSVGNIFGMDVYKIKHLMSKQALYITRKDIKKC